MTRIMRAHFDALKVELAWMDGYAFGTESGCLQSCVAAVRKHVKFIQQLTDEQPEAEGEPTDESEAE